MRLPSPGMSLVALLAALTLLARHMEAAPANLPPVADLDDSSLAGQPHLLRQHIREVIETIPDDAPTLLAAREQADEVDEELLEIASSEPTLSDEIRTGMDNCEEKEGDEISTATLATYGVMRRAALDREACAKNLAIKLRAPK